MEKPKDKLAAREVGIYGTGAAEDSITHRILESGQRNPADVAAVEEASKGHPSDCYCWACACLRRLNEDEGVKA